MSTASTRPPLFDPEPGGSDGGGQGARPQFPRKRAGGGSASGGWSGGGGSSSPRWVRPFIFGGLVLVAVISLASFLAGDEGGGGQQPPPTAVADPEQDVGDDTGDGGPDAEQVGAEEDPAAGTAAQQAAETPATSPSPADDATAEDAVAQGDGAQDGTAPAGQPVAADPALQRAAAFAVQFANEYLNYDEAAPEGRERNLRAYLAPDLDPQLGWDGNGRQSAVSTVPVETVVDDDRVVVTVASNVTGESYPRWVHLAVPLAADAQGRWAVVERPSFVPAPPAGTPELDGIAVDEALSTELAPVMEQLFQAYGADSSVDVGGVTSPDARIRGLAGQVSLVAVDSVRIGQDGGDRREGLVAVTWSDAVTGASFAQTYEVVLEAADGGWHVESVGSR